jgi:integrase
MSPRNREHDTDLPKGLYKHRRQFRCRAWNDEFGVKHPTRAEGTKAYWKLFDPPLADAAKAFYDFRGIEQVKVGPMERAIRKYMDTKVPELLDAGDMSASTWRAERPRCEKLIHHFGRMDPRHVRKRDLYEVMDWHPPQAGKKLIKRLSAIYKYLIRWDLADVNPCIGIEYPKDKARDRYVTDKEFDLALSVSRDRASKPGHGPAVVYGVLLLELLTGRRESDILRIDLRDLADDGILISERKTAKQTLVQWTDELRAAVDDVRRVCHCDGKITSTRLITDGDGMPVSERYLNNAWQRLRPWLD